MILGIGTDIVDIQRIEKAIARFGPRFAQRVLSESEYFEYQQAYHPPAFLAKRFAAKEATAKALGTGFRSGLKFQHISVANDDMGRPAIELVSRAGDIAADKGIDNLLLSLADERRYAIAFVTATSKEFAVST